MIRKKQKKDSEIKKVTYSIILYGLARVTQEIQFTRIVQEAMPVQEPTGEGDTGEKVELARKELILDGTGSNQH